jgi:hypothetical protein
MDGPDLLVRLCGQNRERGQVLPLLLQHMRRRWDENNRVLDEHRKQMEKEAVRLNNHDDPNKHRDKDRLQDR